MKTLDYFKKEHNLARLDFRASSSGREILPLPNGENVIKSSRLDKTKPMFVNTITKDEDGNPMDKPLHVVCNFNLSDEVTDSL